MALEWMAMLEVVALVVALIALAVAVWNTHATRRNSLLMTANTRAADDNTKATTINTRATDFNSDALAENTAAALATMEGR